MILVFDALLSNPKYSTSMTCSFDSLETIHETAMQQHSVGDLLRLCVGVGNRHEMDLTDSEYEAEYARRVLWCLDRGYEYVETDLQNVHEGHDDRDKEGFARIIEAISGTVWSTAVMNKKKQKELKQSYQEEAANIRGENKGGQLSENGGSYEPPTIDTETPKETSSTLTDQERETKARQALLVDVEDEAAPENGATLSESRQAELEEERNLNALESSLHEARRIRELSQSGQLTDEERRQRASEAATLIYEMMGKMGFDSDSEENDDEAAEAKEEKTDDS